MIVSINGREITSQNAVTIRIHKRYTITLKMILGT